MSLFLRQVLRKNTLANLFSLVGVSISSVLSTAGRGGGAEDGRGRRVLRPLRGHRGGEGQPGPLGLAQLSGEERFFVAKPHVFRSDSQWSSPQDSPCM